jgi:dihydroorotate dehydrogenase
VLYRALYTLLLQQVPPELAHRLGSWSLRIVACTSRTRALLRRLAFPGDPEVLTVRALGLTFPSPLGAAAGLDKTADWFDALGAIGFGFVEVGTITPSAQKSNPPPIIRRLPADRALVNRMGFPNSGVAAAVRRLQRRSRETIVGTNISKARATALEQATADYRAVARLVAPYADYVVLNVSSPNTAGLRDLEAVERLEPLVVAAREELGDKPLLVKISPDLDDEQIDAIAELALRLGLAGIVAVNTTVDRSVLSSEGTRQAAGFEGGGVSGPPLRTRALAVLRRLHERVGDRLVLVSVGGIETPEDAWERILAGATLVQAYTGFIYGGPGWPRRINRELASRVRTSGAGSIQELVGRDQR